MKTARYPEDSGPDFATDCLQRGDVRRLQALRTVHDLELHALTLGQRAEALSRDGGVVHEHVGPALLSDEPKPLRVVEPLHGTLFHGMPLRAGRPARRTRYCW